MNAESLKTELQQVLENDLVLRKEFNELKRSLSDYRNQLIMRDEDCKRLQVTIDVLNTKLVVMERDNTNYKGELASFKELRGSIKEQLHSKQEEIEQRLAEIESLKSDLNSISSDYELKIEGIKVTGFTKLKLKYDLAPNASSSSSASDFNVITVKVNGVAVTVPSRPVGFADNNKFSTIELSNIPALATNTIEFFGALASNNLGMRLDNVVIIGVN